MESLEVDYLASRSRSLPVSDFDLESTLDSGQVFHWEGNREAGFAGCIGDDAVWLRQPDPERLDIFPETMTDAVRRYFRLDEDHGRVLASMPAGDPVLSEAVAYCRGLRIVRQPLWECLATFITSSLKQVAHIRQISLRLRRELGEKRDIGGVSVFAYPAPEVYAAAGETRLREFGMGYRAKSLVRAGERLRVEPGVLEEARGLSEGELREFLCGFYGVGEKIANCVILFGYGRLGAFPIDVWIERVLRERYFPGKRKPVSRKELAVFALEHFGDYGGYAQQFLFHHARKTRGRSS